jgi:hypothetical protein
MRAVLADLGPRTQPATKQYTIHHMHYALYDCALHPLPLPTPLPKLKTAHSPPSTFLWGAAALFPSGSARGPWTLRGGIWPRLFKGPIRGAPGTNWIAALGPAPLPLPAPLAYVLLNLSPEGDTIPLPWHTPLPLPQIPIPICLSFVVSLSHSLGHLLELFRSFRPTISLAPFELP